MEYWKAGEQESKRKRAKRNRPVLTLMTGWTSAESNVDVQMILTWWHISLFTIWSLLCRPLDRNLHRENEKSEVLTDSPRLFVGFEFPSVDVLPVLEYVRIAVDSKRGETRMDLRNLRK